VTRRIIVGISGASGIVYGLRALQLLRECEVESHLVVSKSAKLTLHHELDMSLEELQSLASEVHPAGNIGASIAAVPSRLPACSLHPARFAPCRRSPPG